MHEQALAGVTDTTVGGRVFQQWEGPLKAAITKAQAPFLGLLGGLMPAAARSAIARDVNVTPGAWSFAQRLEQFPALFAVWLAEHVMNGLGQHGYYEVYPFVQRAVGASSPLNQNDKERLWASFRRALVKLGLEPVPRDAPNSYRLTGEYVRQAGVPIAFADDLAERMLRYAPGAEVVANGRIWQSAGLAKYPRAFMPTRWYAACQECYHVDTAETRADLPAACTNCGSDKGWQERKRMFVEPKGFVTSSGLRRGRDPGTSRRRMRPADEARLIAAPRPEQFKTTELEFLRTAFLPAHVTDAGDLQGSLFVANRGAYGYGYNRCLRCDYAEPKKRVTAANRARAGAAQPSFVHLDPLSGRPCEHNLLPKLGVDFAHRFDTDVRLLRFLSPLPEPEDRAVDSRLYQERVARTLAEATRHAATDLMSLQRKRAMNCVLDRGAVA